MVRVPHVPETIFVSRYNFLLTELSFPNYSPYLSPVNAVPKICVFSTSTIDSFAGP